MKKIIKQGISFILISGMGFIMDFAIYYILINSIRIKLSYANMISSIPAITYVFFMSTRKVFARHNSKIPIACKYIIYFGYQIILVTSVSIVAESLYHTLYIYSIFFEKIPINIKIIIKLLITPITMICNFFAMKILCEKI